MLFISIAMMAGNYLGGWLFDHWSPYKSAVLGVACSTLAIASLIVWHGWPWFAVLLVINSFGDGINMTIINSYGTGVANHTSRFVFNYIYMAFNVGVVIGTLLVGILLPISVVLVFTVATVFYMALSVVVIGTFNAPLAKRPQNQSRHSKVRLKGQPLLQLVYLILLNVITIHISY